MVHSGIPNIWQTRYRCNKINLTLVLSINQPHILVFKHQKRPLKLINGLKII